MVRYFIKAGGLVCDAVYVNNKKKAVGFKKNVMNHDLIFHYNIRVDHLLGIGYVAVRLIPCRCSAFFMETGFSMEYNSR